MVLSHAVLTMSLKPWPNGVHLMSATPARCPPALRCPALSSSDRAGQAKGTLKKVAVKMIQMATTKKSPLLPPPPSHPPPPPCSAAPVVRPRGRRGCRRNRAAPYNTHHTIRYTLSSALDLNFRKMMRSLSLSLYLARYMSFVIDVIDGQQLSWTGLRSLLGSRSPLISPCANTFLARVAPVLCEHGRAVY